MVQRHEASAAMHESTRSFIDAEGARHSSERRSPNPEDDQVLEHTWHWLKALPKAIRPVHLPVMFPRIANSLSRLWPETAALDHYFEEKEFSPRPDRRGFPPIIKEELLAVHLYSLHTRPRAHSEQLPQQGSLLS
jgi:hypothetical protein